MELLVLGSGGYLRIPRACCACKVCNDARKRGPPYERLGQSIFIKDANILFDAPEDINTELNRARAPSVDHLFISHWHPDHTAGIRILEQLREGNAKAPVNVYMTDSLKTSLEQRVPTLTFFETKKYCQRIVDSHAKIGSIDVTLIPLTNGFSYAFMIKQGNRRILHCPCHAMHLPVRDDFVGVDVLLMNCGTFATDNKDVTQFERDNIRLIDAITPKKTILTHIEESFGKGPKEYKALEREYKSRRVLFAYDGMTLTL